MLAESIADAIIEKRRDEEREAYQRIEADMKRRKAREIKMRRKFNAVTFRRMAVQDALTSIHSAQPNDPDFETFELVGFDKIRRRESEPAPTHRYYRPAPPRPVQRASETARLLTKRVSAASEGPIVTFQYLGARTHVAGTRGFQPAHIVVEQQYGGAAVRSVFDGNVFPGDTFHFASIRKPDAQFALTVG